MLAESIYEKMRLDCRVLVHEAKIACILPWSSPCVECGKPGRAHHESYARPLDVMWLCRSHHAELHWQYELAGCRTPNPRGIGPYTQYRQYWNDALTIAKELRVKYGRLKTPEVMGRIVLELGFDPENQPLPDQWLMP